VRAVTHALASPAVISQVQTVNGLTASPRAYHTVNQGGPSSARLISNDGSTLDPNAQAIQVGDGVWVFAALQGIYCKMAAVDAVGTMVAARHDGGSYSACDAPTIQANWETANEAPLGYYSVAEVEFQIAGQCNTQTGTQWSVQHSVQHSDPAPACQAYCDGPGPPGAVKRP
jgi:hypothetical protein